MPHFGALLNELFVDLNAKPWTLGNGTETVFNGERRFIDQVVEHVVALVVVNTHALLLDKGVVADCIQL